MLLAGSELLVRQPTIITMHATTAASGLFDGFRQAGAGKVLAYALAGGTPAAFFAVARRLAVTRGTDPHDFKFPVAACDDLRHASPAVRPRLLAASVFWIRDSGDRISPAVERARAAGQNT